MNSQVRTTTPLAHHEHAGAGDGLLAVEPDGVDVHAGGEDHLLAVVESRDHLETSLDAPRALEIQVGSRLGHLRLELAHHLGALAGEEPLDAADVSGVLSRRDGPHARPGAASHVVVEARAPLLGADEIDDVLVALVRLGDTPAALPLGAGRDADGDDLADGVDGVARGAAVGVGPEVARTGRCRSRVYLMAGKRSPLVRAMKG